jgi:hypothetical protein
LQRRSCRTRDIHRRHGEICGLQTTLAQLTERFPDRGKIEGSETETNYTSEVFEPYILTGNKKEDLIGKKMEGEFYDYKRKKDEKWLQDFYYHYDVFALHIPSFAIFDALYPCTFVPIEGNETSAESN